MACLHEAVEGTLPLDRDYLLNREKRVGWLEARKGTLLLELL